MLFIEIVNAQEDYDDSGGGESDDDTSDGDTGDDTSDGDTGDDTSDGDTGDDTSDGDTGESYNGDFGNTAGFSVDSDPATDPWFDNPSQPSVGSSNVPPLENSMRNIPPDPLPLDSPRDSLVESPILPEAPPVADELPAGGLRTLSDLPTLSPEEEEIPPVADEPPVPPEAPPVADELPAGGLSTLSDLPTLSPEEEEIPPVADELPVPPEAPPVADELPAGGLSTLSDLPSLPPEEEEIPPVADELPAGGLSTLSDLPSLPPEGDSQAVLEGLDQQADQQGLLSPGWDPYRSKQSWTSI